MINVIICKIRGMGISELHAQEMWSVLLDEFGAPIPICLE